MSEPRDLEYTDIKFIRKNAMEAIALCQKLIIDYDDSGNNENMETANQIIQRNFKILAATADALEYNKLDAYIPQKFSLSQFLKDVVYSCQSVLRRTRINISCECDKNICVSADPDRLLACLLALITNSAQHMDNEIGEGEIELRAKRVANFVTISVKDNGYGMESSDLEDLLDYNKNKGGLAVVKKFCDVIESTLMIETSPDCGFSASFRIPFEGYGDSEMRSSQPIVPISTFSPYNIYLSQIYDAVAQFKL